jgi:acetyltransferase (GNAT) family protein
MRDERCQTNGPKLLDFTDPVELALRMKRLSARMDARSDSDGLMQYRFDAEPFGSAYVTVSSSEQGPVASSNSNRVTLCGTEEGLTAEGLVRIADLFRQAGVKRYYVWLSPGPRIEVVRGWLIDAGMTPNPYVQYPTLARDASPVLPVVTKIEVREVEFSEAKRVVECHEGIAFPEYARLPAETSGWHYFAAFNSGEAIATARLYVRGDLGYLGTAFTGEPFRRRGAQQALIVNRIEAAVALGCRVLISETLSILKNSLSNLEKAGFRTIFEKEVYEANIEA